MQLIANNHIPLFDCVEVAASKDDAFFRHSLFFRQITCIATSQGNNAAAELLRETLRHLIIKHEPLIGSLNYPQSVLTLIQQEFDRIKEFVSTEPADRFNLELHSLRCDFRILCFSRIPVGPNHIEIGGVPRSLFFRGGVSQTIRVFKMLRKTRGFMPFYQTHMSHDVNRYNFLRRSGPDARDEVFRNIAHCLAINPGIRGFICSSWLNDPQLDQVSPHLAFYRRRPLQNGAFLFRYGATQGAYRKALTNSVTRNAVFHQGRYIPTTCIVVWPRESLLRWATDGES